jgi:hypothetical protein
VRDITPARFARFQRRLDSIDRAIEDAIEDVDDMFDSFNEGVVEPGTIQTVQDAKAAMARLEAVTKAYQRVRTYLVYDGGFSSDFSAGTAIERIRRNQLPDFAKALGVLQSGTLEKTEVE